MLETGDFRGNRTCSDRKAVSALGFWVKDLGYAGFGVNVEA